MFFPPHFFELDNIFNDEYQNPTQLPGDFDVKEILFNELLVKNQLATGDEDEEEKDRLLYNYLIDIGWIEKCNP